MKLFAIAIILLQPFQVCMAENLMNKKENPSSLQTVAYVDLIRYTGVWHQIALIPNFFQKNCTINTTATYTLMKNGQVEVINACSKENGKRKSIRGSAKVVDPLSQAKLGVRFFWFQPRAPYWIIELDSEYTYAVVGTPNRKYLWILSRTPSMDKKTYVHLLDRARAQGFDTHSIKLTAPINED